MIIEDEARRQIIAIGKRIYANGFVVATDGNISIRLAPNRFLVTRSGVCKGDMTDRDLVICDQNGKTIRGGRVSSEVLLHLAAYSLRSDIEAAIHAHPPTAIAFTLAGVSLTEAILPEVIISLGAIPTALFAAPSSPEGAEVIRDEIVKHDAILLDRHGSLTVGRTLMEAYYKLERIEFAARIMHTARVLGEVKPLNQEEMLKVQQTIERQKGVEQRGTECCPHCGAALPKSSLDSPSAIADRWYGADLERLAPLIRRIIQEGRM